MAGWMYLPRLIDKIRLSHHKILPLEYQENFIVRGFDQAWFGASGVDSTLFVAFVNQTVTDGEVCDWILRNVTATEEQRAHFNEMLLSHGSQTPELKARLEQRKAESGLSHRSDITTFVQYIDADEGR
jgi:hypothetical protein